MISQDGKNFASRGKKLTREALNCTPFDGQRGLAASAKVAGALRPNRQAARCLTSMRLAPACTEIS